MGFSYGITGEFQPVNGNIVGMWMGLSHNGNILMDYPSKILPYSPMMWYWHTMLGISDVATYNTQEWDDLEVLMIDNVTYMGDNGWYIVVI